MSVFVTNSPTRMCCGEPAESCRCFDDGGAEGRGADDPLSNALAFLPRFDGPPARGIENVSALARWLEGSSLDPNLLLLPEPAVVANVGPTDPDPDGPLSSMPWSKADEGTVNSRRLTANADGDLLIPPPTF